MNYSISSVSWLLVLCFLTSCLTPQIKNSKQPRQLEKEYSEGQLAFTVYQFLGNVHDGQGRQCWANVEIRTDSSLIHGVTTEFETGNYSFSISAKKIATATLIRVTSTGYDTITRKIIPRELQDSVVFNDFVMELSTTDHTIIQGHRPGMLNQPLPDTIWLDKQGNPLPSKPKPEAE